MVRHGDPRPPARAISALSNAIGGSAMSEDSFNRKGQIAWERNRQRHGGLNRRHFIGATVAAAGMRKWSAQSQSPDLLKPRWCFGSDSNRHPLAWTGF